MRASAARQPGEMPSACTKVKVMVMITDQNCLSTEAQFIRSVSVTDLVQELSSPKAKSTTSDSKFEFISVEQLSLPCYSTLPQQ